MDRRRGQEPYAKGIRLRGSPPHRPHFSTSTVMVPASPSAPIRGDESRLAIGAANFESPFTIATLGEWQIALCGGFTSTGHLTRRWAGGRSSARILSSSLRTFSAMPLGVRRGPGSVRKTVGLASVSVSPRPQYTPLNAIESILMRPVLPHQPTTGPDCRKGAVGSPTQWLKQLGNFRGNYFPGIIFLYGSDKTITGLRGGRGGSQSGLAPMRAAWHGGQRATERCSA